MCRKGKHQRDRIGVRWGKLEKGCEGGRAREQECQEWCRTRWRLDVEGREDGVSGDAGQWVELPGRKEQQEACGPGKAVTQPDRWG